MGTDKAWMEIASIPVIERVISAAAAVIDAVVIVGPSDAVPFSRFDCEVWPDRFADRGPLGGLHTAFSRGCPNGALLLSCDLPFINSAILQLLLDRSHTVDAVVPVAGRALQPLCAFYARSCAPRVERALERGELAMCSFVETLRTTRVLPDEYCHLGHEDSLFLNLNTPQDYDAAVEVARQMGDL